MLVDEVMLVSEWGRTGLAAGLAIHLREDWCSLVQKRGQTRLQKASIGVLLPRLLGLPVTESPNVSVRWTNSHKKAHRSLHNEVSSRGLYSLEGLSCRLVVRHHQRQSLSRGRPRRKFVIFFVVQQALSSSNTRLERRLERLHLIVSTFFFNGLWGAPRPTLDASTM